MMYTNKYFVFSQKSKCGFETFGWNISGISPDKTSDGHVIPMSKQTVAEAAKACGSSLHLYRNPFENDPYDNNAEEQSIDDCSQHDLNGTKLVVKWTHYLLTDLLSLPTVLKILHHSFHM